ncbi:MAG: TonB-dependent receptor [Acidobacteria bacterium]|nr:TonB-dependent receptor [Acidobacteriota bacterium]
MSVSALRVIAVCLFAVVTFAQVDRGTIAGTISDPTGAIVVSVNVRITHEATNASYNSTTGPTGSFSFFNLPVGAYNLTAEAAGFRRAEIKGVKVEVNQQAKVDVTLQVGEVTQTVEVAATASLVQTESTDVGAVIDNKRFLDLPLTLGGGIRNPSAFIFLSPGVSPGNTWEKHIAGGGSFNDQIYYDGIALSRGDLANDAEVNPSVDAIAEFKLVTNNYSAEYTHAFSGVTSFTMKSGANALHGSAFHFLANDKLDARGFFNPIKAARKQNEWGLTVGGPVLLPKLYNGRDRTFFFFSLDQYYIRGGQLAGFNTNATSKMLQGDFSEWEAAGRGPIADPRSTVIDASGQARRTPFANNLIPRSMFSAVSSKMLQYYPPAELPGIANNSIAPLGSPMADQRTSGFKIDHQIKPNHRLSGMFNYTDRPSIKSPAPSRLIAIGRSTAIENYNFQVVTTRIIRVNYDWNIGPTLMNHMGGGFSRFRNPNFSLGFNQGWTQPDGGKLGLRGLQFDLAPTVQYTQAYTRLGDDIASDNYFTTLAWLDTLTWVKNKHTLKMGVEVQTHRDNYRNYGAGGGRFNFSHFETQIPGVANSGNAFASFLLGAVDGGNSFFRDSLPGGRYKYYGWFLDDTYKITPKLTLNMGLRYEIQAPSSDPLGRLSYMDPSVPNPGAGNLPGAYVVGGSGPGRQGWTRFFDIQYKNFAPRFGFAYQWMRDTVLRGGYGIFYKEYINQGVGLPQTGFSITPSFSSPNNGITSGFWWDDGFPQNFNRPPLISPTVANTQGASIAERATGGMIPYAQQWNLTIERQFANSLLISAAYVANKGTHIYDSLVLSQVHPNLYSLGATLLQANITSPLAQQAGIKEPYAGFAQQYGSRGTVAQALRPYPQFTGVSTVAAPYANSAYHSFQFKLDKRFSHGFSGTMAYTFGKHLSDGAGFTDTHGGVLRQNYYTREKALYASDQPHILTFSFNYAIPFRHRLLGGWSTSGVAAYSSGFPLAISTPNTSSFIFNGGMRPNLTGAPIRAPQSGDTFDPNKDAYLNRAAFSAPAPLTFGNAPVYLNERQPYYVQEAFGLFKDTHFTERFNLQFRLEINNPFNRVRFGAPSTDLSAANFGRIGSQGNSPRVIQFGLKLLY